MAKESGRDKEEVLAELIAARPAANRQRAIVHLIGIGTFALFVSAVFLFTPFRLIDQKHVERLTAIGMFAFATNLLLGIGASWAKRKLGYRWGFVEIAGALLGSAALAVQIFYGDRSDYGLWLLAELAVLFGIVKGIDTIEKGIVDQPKPE